MRALWMSFVLGLVGIGILGATPSQAQAQWRRGWWRGPVYSSYYYPGYTYYTPGYASYYYYPGYGTYYTPYYRSYYYAPSTYYYPSYSSYYTPYYSYYYYPWY